jgi:hypothetical protein
MAGISGIRKVAKLMGDTSSLKGGGDASVPSQLLGRGARRGFGSQIGPLQGGLSIWGLVMYAEFLTFLKRLMDKKLSWKQLVPIRGSHQDRISLERHSRYKIRRPG